MYHHVTKAPSSPRTLRPDIPAQLDKLILELLAKNPDARPASACRVATALRAIQQRRTSPAHQRASTRNQVVRLPSRSAITTGLAFRYAVRSDVGLLREGNEDSAYAGPRLLAVADGMGGNTAGEVASALTIASMAELDASMAELDAEQPGGDMRAALAMAVVAANARLHEKIIANPAVEGMGTTLTALLWSDGHAAVCHIGDSRGYLLRDGELYQITHDHTLVQSLVDEGRISADDVSTHPQRSLLLRALDGRSIAEPDLSVHQSLPGDRYLLCSDGLSGVVSDETLLDTLSTIEDPEVATRELIELAIRGGGPDNITCIVADVVDAATTRWPPTTTPVLAGAAATLDDLRLADGSGPLRLRGPPRGRRTDRVDRADRRSPGATTPSSAVTTRARADQAASSSAATATRGCARASSRVGGCAHPSSRSRPADSHRGTGPEIWVERQGFTQLVKPT